MQLQLDIGIQKKQKNGKYFQLPPTNGYKENSPYEIEEVFKDKIEELKPKQDTVIVDNEEDIIKYSKMGYSCNPIGNNKWLMKN